jgi:hypothetical protein
MYLHFKFKFKFLKKKKKKNSKEIHTKIHRKIDTADKISKPYTTMH